MKKIALLSMLLVAGFSQAGIMEGTQFGGSNAEGRLRDWSGPLTWASTTDTDLVFTIAVSVTGTNAIPANNTAHFEAPTIGVHSDVAQTQQKRLEINETVTVSISYVDPNLSLLSLDLVNISSGYNNSGTERVDFIDQFGTRFNVENIDTEIAYNTTGLEALTKDNAKTGWTLTAEGMTATTTSGFGSFELTYEVVPEPATLGLVAMVGGGLMFIRRRFMI